MWYSLTALSSSTYLYTHYAYPEVLTDASNQSSKRCRRRPQHCCYNVGSNNNPKHRLSRSRTNMKLTHQFSQRMRQSLRSLLPSTLLATFSAHGKEQQNKQINYHFHDPRNLKCHERQALYISHDEEECYLLRYL